MKFIHTADLHLGASLKSMKFLSPEAHKKRVHEMMDTFYRLLQKAKEDSVDCLFIVGDLFDHDYIHQAVVERVFKALTDTNIKVFLVIGNHDTFLHKPAYQRLLKAANIHIFDEKTQKFSLKETDIYGINTSDFTASLFDALNESLDANKNNVLLLHGDVFNKSDDHFLISAKALEASRFDYIALGHIHKHQVLGEKTVYSGNLEPTDFGEIGDKGYIEGHLAHQAVDFTFVPFAKRTYKTYTLTLNEDDNIYTIKQSILAKVSTLSRTKDFVRITLKGATDPLAKIDKDALTLLLEDEFYYLEIKDETHLALDLEKLKETYKDTLIEALILDYEEEGNKKLGEESLTEALYALLKTKEGTL